MQYKESRRATRGTRFLTLHLLLYGLIPYTGHRGCRVGACPVPGAAPARVGSGHRARLTVLELLYMYARRDIDL